MTEYVTIFAPVGHRFHNRKAQVFHRFDDGRINVQLQLSQRKGHVANITLKPGQYVEAESMD